MFRPAHATFLPTLEYRVVAEAGSGRASPGGKKCRPARQNLPSRSALPRCEPALTGW
jgi:hypothetical protein